MIKLYLSGIRHAHIVRGLLESQAGPILHSLLTAWSTLSGENHVHDFAMLRTAVTMFLCFFLIRGNYCAVVVAVRRRGALVMWLRIRHPRHQWFACTGRGRSMTSLEKASTSTWTIRAPRFAQWRNCWSTSVVAVRPKELSFALVMASP